MLRSDRERERERHDGKGYGERKRKRAKGYKNNKGKNGWEGNTEILAILETGKHPS